MRGGSASVWGQVCGIMDAGAHIGGKLALISLFLV